MSRRYFANTATQQTLQSSISSSDTSLTINGSFSGWPTQFPFFATLDIGKTAVEVISVTAITGSTATIVRGEGGTAALGHLAGATIDHTVVAADLDEPNSHVNSDSGVHGVTGSVVGTTDTQTLTNKTLASPAMTGTATAAALTTTGNVQVGGTLTSTGDVTASGKLNVTGKLTTTTDAAVGGNLTVTGTVNGEALSPAWVALTPASGWATYQVAPAYRIHQGRVEFRGAVKKSSGSLAASTWTSILSTADPNVPAAWGGFLFLPCALDNASAGIVGPAHAGFQVFTPSTGATTVYLEGMSYSL